MYANYEELYGDLNYQNFSRKKTEYKKIEIKFSYVRYGGVGEVGVAGYAFSRNQAHCPMLSRDQVPFLRELKYTNVCTKKPERLDVFFDAH